MSWTQGELKERDEETNEDSRSRFESALELGVLKVPSVKVSFPFD